MTAYDRYIKWPESLDVVVLDIWVLRRQLLKKKNHETTSFGNRNFNVIILVIGFSK